jgi:3-oxoacyl-[acyl-carrier-protein] synthase-3
VSVTIIGSGKALGGRIESNADLEAATGISASWVLSKTGITQRHKVAPGETVVTLALQASQEALRRADVSASAVGLTIVCTFTPEYLFPPLSARVHNDLGMRGGHFFDVQANCSGFITALVIASDRMNADPSLDYALIVGAEVLSPYVNPSDPETAAFFSDVAGAVVVGRGEGRIVSSAFDADTSNYSSVRCDRDGFMVQSGLVTWKKAVTHLPPTIRRAMASAGWSQDDVDLVLMHQANAVLIRFLMGRLGIPVEKTFTNVETVGNGGSASLPAVIADAMAAGPLHSGMKIILAGIGAGYSFASVCMET